MTGTVAVWAEAPPFGRAGKLGVVIDGRKVGSVQQGEVAEFPVEAGPRTVRIAAGGSRSNTVAVTVGDGETSRVVCHSTGLRVAALVPLLGLVLGSVPGLLFRLRPHEPRPTPAPTPAPADRAHEAGTAGSTGLWWESDPVLAKRYRKAAASDGTE